MINLFDSFVGHCLALSGQTMSEQLRFVDARCEPCTVKSLQTLHTVTFKVNSAESLRWNAVDQAYSTQTDEHCETDRRTTNTAAACLPLSRQTTAVCLGSTTECSITSNEVHPMNAVWWALFGRCRKPVDKVKRCCSKLIAIKPFGRSAYSETQMVDTGF